MFHRVYAISQQLICVLILQVWGSANYLLEQVWFIQCSSIDFKSTSVLSNLPCRERKHALNWHQLSMWAGHKSSLGFCKAILKTS